MQLIVDNLIINYQRKGRGKKILLIHGWAVNHHSLDIIFNELTPNFDVLSVDLPGFGGSQTPEIVWGLEEYSAFLKDFLNKLKIKSVYAVIGHSNGGAIAIKAVSASYISADKLVVLSSAGIRGEDKTKLLTIKLITKAGKIISTPLPKSTKKRLRKKLYNTIQSDYLTADNMTESFKKIVSQDIRHDAESLDLPVLLIYGSDDDQTPAMYGRMFHQLIKNSTLEIVGTAGHFVYQDKPQVVVKLLRDFLC